MQNKPAGKGLGFNSIATTALGIATTILFRFSPKPVVAIRSLAGALFSKFCFQNRNMFAVNILHQKFKSHEKHHQAIPVLGVGRAVHLLFQCA
ncbi:MAG: hypothetical protein H6577_11470 [Lewinellaceae bacterium]|nr:hypothetical protein [Saprospiraceae bacterium]MCB9338735.1 hypothetical protein [Lewinellaceae bacterium]